MEDIIELNVCFQMSVVITCGIL